MQTTWSFVSVTYTQKRPSHFASDTRSVSSSILYIECTGLKRIHLPDNIVLVGAVGTIALECFATLDSLHSGNAHQQYVFMRRGVDV